MSADIGSGPAALLEPATVVELGRTDLTVTRLGLGCAPLGGVVFEAVSDDMAHAVVKRAWELGIRLFDTAPLYGFGLSERRLGEALAAFPRSEYVLCTKVGRLVSPSQAGPASSAVFDFSHDGVLRSLEASLERLGAERIDVVHIHDPDDHFDEALSGALTALVRLRASGVIGAVGAGMNQVEMLKRFSQSGGFDCFLLAGRLSLLDHDGAHELLEMCDREGIALIIGGVYNSGILADPSPGATFEYAQAPAELLARAQQIEQICTRHGVPLKAAAIQFPFLHPAVTSVLTGCRTSDEVDENARMLSVSIPSDLWRELREEGFLAEAISLPSGGDSV
jgi:D-threo-aldose 1-dehydrogenase